MAGRQAELGPRGEGSDQVEGVLDRLEALSGNLPPTAARIADFIFANVRDVVHMSVTEVAERAEASESSVVSLCQQIGMRGFQQLKTALARDLVQPIQFIHEDLAREDPTATVVEKSFRSACRRCRTR